ncbi:hypothetical protein AcV5_003390 [Taiwanofungus camphoratus]|nr:hypothetical protein AcV5_003390 [Antrodia cinnamomea]KAI0935100.1 hypothetical protein AcV7_004000 [Antrodia cinnamomea]
MALTLSFDDLGSWDDLDIVSPVTEDEEVQDPRTIDPRTTPPDIVEIDKSVAELEAELARLKLKKAQILASQALIVRLPPELLSRIFEFGVHENTNLLPIILLVCHYWRDTALGTPSLWTYIILDSQWGLGRTPAFLRKLRACLGRSQTCKLLVNIDLGYIDNEEMHDIMTELRPHLARCFSFRVSAPCWDSLPLLREHISSLGPSLEELHIRISATDLQETTPYCTLLAQACPRLKTVILEHIPLICTRVQLPTLQRLYLMRDQQYRRSANRRFSVVFQELLTMLTSTPELDELRLQSVVFTLNGDEDIFQGTPVLTTIPSLRVLSFNLVDSINISLFLDSTSLPALTRLSVNMEPSAEENIHWLSRISLASPTRFSALRQLELRTCNIDGPALVPFVRALHQLPQLTALSLSSPRLGFLGGQIFDLLAAGPATTGIWLLPQLQALCVHQCMDVTGHELLRVVCARHQSGSDVTPILYLKISQCDSFDPDVLEQLNNVVDTVRVL